MRDRRKELIKQWLQEPTGNEGEPAVVGNLVSNRMEDQLEPGNPSECYKQSELGSCGSSGLDRRKICHDVKFSLNRRNWRGNQVLHRNSYHLLDHDLEGAKYRAMLQQFLGSQNRVFCFPPQLNSFQRRLVHVEAEKLGLHHRSCGQGWERFMVVTKPGRSTEPTCDNDVMNEICNEKKEISGKKSERPQSLPSLASKLCQVTGRTIVQPDPSNSEERYESKQLVDEDDRRQLFEAKEASGPEMKLQATIPCSTLPDDPVEVQRLRAEFEQKAFIFPEDEKNLTGEEVDASTLLTDHSSSRHDLENVGGKTEKQGSGEVECVGKDKPELVEEAKTSSTDHYTLRIPLQSGSGGSELLLQNVSDDLAWFDHLVSVNPLGQVVEAVFASEESVEAAIMGLKGKYPGISRKVDLDLKRHPSTGLYTLSFIDTDRLRYRATLRHFSAFGEVPVVLRGSKRDEVTVGFKSENAAASALATCEGVSSFTDIQNIVS